MPEPKPKKPPKLPKFFRELITQAEAQAQASDTGPLLVAGKLSPICVKCGLNECGAQNPFLPYKGSEAPLITILMDAANSNEDRQGELAVEASPAGLLLKTMQAVAPPGFDMARIRWVPTTRCANRSKEKVNYATKGNWCRYHAVEDLHLYPPALVMPVGTVALGLLNHKSSAQDWGGRLLTWRGWPDDWLTNDKWAADGHPFFGPLTGFPRLPMVPVQSPRLVYATQNPHDQGRWRRHLKRAMELAMGGAKALEYGRPWFRLIADDPNELAQALAEIPDDAVVTYDTETTGLWPFLAGSKIVFMMLRWDDPDGSPRALAWPWDYPESPLFAHVAQLTPLVLRALYRVRLVGHNLAFDILFTFGTLAGCDLDRLTASMHADTRHLIYALRQNRESLGLERVAYDWCPDMAGYEEEFELLKQRMPALLDPGANEGGHYAKCPTSLWETHLKPYVFGDVEVAHWTKFNVEAKLTDAKRYKIPLSDPDRLGCFRDYEPISRKEMYEGVMQPANRLLTRMMGRGMHVDQDEMKVQEDLFPKLIREARGKLREADERVVRWCDAQEGTVEGWELDLESRDQLKAILFDVLGLPVKRLTDSGIKAFGEDVSAVPADRLMEFAAIDKFTLNGLAAEFPRLKPLQDYRKLFKQWSMYVRSMRNVKVSGIDKKERTKQQYLMGDGRVHTSYNLCGTGSGRLAAKQPNMAQLMRGSIIKRMYASRFGLTDGCMYQADLSQIELRLLAAGCGDPLMVQAYKDGVDLHSLTTSKIFKLPYEHLEKDYMEWLQKNSREKEAKDLNQKRSIGKCVDPDTIIEVNGQLMRIADLHPGRQDDTFYGLEHEALFVRGPQSRVKVGKFYCNGVADRLLVATRRGLLTCSKQHRFQMEDGRLVQAKDLKKGDTLSAYQPLRATVTCDAPEIGFDPLGNGLPLGNNNFSVKVDNNFAYLLGLFFGDGCSSTNAVSIATGGTPNYFGWQDQIAEVATAAGLSPTIQRTVWLNKERVVLSGPNAGLSVRGSCGKVTLGSRRVSDVLIQLGAINNDATRSRTLKIPLWLLNAGPEIKLSFLAGLFDTDGSVSVQGGIDVATKSWVFAQDLGVMMRGLGIRLSFDCPWNNVYKRYYYRIRLGPAASWDFFRGRLKMAHKLGRLRNPTNRYIAEKPNAVLLVEELEPGLLLEVSVNSEDHLYCPNGITTHNTVNFLTGYGGGAYGLQSTLAEEGVFLPLEECERIVEALFDTYPALRTHIGYYKNFIMKHGCAVSLMGRVRAFDEVYSEDHGFVAKALRSGYNHLIQSSASDMMMISMTAIERLMRAESLRSIMVATVYDSLVIDALRAELPVIHEICMSVLNNMPEVVSLALGPSFDASWLHVLPFGADAEVGVNYGDSFNLSMYPDWDQVANQLSRQRAT